MPFSRYQIRNEFSLADPELYKAADKDDPEALLEGVAMAGLVGVLRQLGDLAEFAAEIFHDLHEEVMVTATRGHGLLVRVQQLESDFPSIERAFLSQTGHSAFFSSPGIGWHPNLRTEQNLITKGDLPRFVMDSYEECRGPPRLFLLDKFDVAGAGACLKRYTDPSFYKVETASYEMMSAEAQRDKKIRKTKKKGSQWKNGKTPEVFQPSHVKLHQLLLEERIQNGASEPARRVKLKKRQSKFPFDMENGKGYMEKLLSSPPEDKLVHEVPVDVNRFGPRLERFEVSMVDPPLASPRQNGSPYESPSVDKTVSREHMDNGLENEPGRMVSEMPTLSIRLQTGRVDFETEEVEEKHISVDGKCKVDGIEDGYESNEVASEVDDFVDALATMESEIETDPEYRANSDPSIKPETSSDTNVKQIQSQSSGSRSASDDESSSIRKKITSFSYSDTTSTSVDNMSPRGVGVGVDSPRAFASTEIPFRPRILPNEVSVNCNEASDISSHRSETDTALPVDQGAIFKESTSKDSDLSEMSSNKRVDVNSPTRTEVSIDPETIIDSTIDDPSLTSFVGNPWCEVDSEDHNSDSTLVISHVEEQPFGPSLDELDICDADAKPSESSFSSDIQPAEGDLLECKPDPAEVGISYSGENETQLSNRETVSGDPESKDATAAVCDPADDRNGDDNLSTLEDEKESKEIEPESVSTHDDVDSNESNGLSTCENTEFEGKEVEFDSETKAVTFAVSDPGAVEKNEDDGLRIAEEPGENGLVNNESGGVQNSGVFVEKKESSEQSVISSELDLVDSNIQFLDSIHNSSQDTCSIVNKNDVDNLSAKTGSTESGEKKESSEHLVISQELDSVPSAKTGSTESGEKKESSEHLVISRELDLVSSASDDHTNIQYHDSIPTSSLEDMNEDDVGNPSADLKIVHDESVFAIEKPDQNGLQTDVSPDVDLNPVNHVHNDQSNARFLDSSPNPPLSTEGQVDHVEKLENASSVLSDSVIEEKVDHETHDAHSEPYPVNHESYSLEQDERFQVHAESSKSEEPSMADFSDRVDHPSAPMFSGYNMLPVLAPINLEEMPPLPPLPPMQWRMGKPQNSSLISRTDGGQQDISHFPSDFPQIVSHPSLDQDEKPANVKAEHDYDDTESSSQVLPPESSLHTEEDVNLATSSEVKFAEEIVPQPPFSSQETQSVSISEREIIRPSSTSSLPQADDERPNGIRPMKVQRPRTPLIDAVAAHDKSKLRKVSERARPLIPKEEERDTLQLRKVSERARPLTPKEEERDTLLEQIRAKSFNLKPAVQTRPSIQGPTTNLRVAAILEKANAIRQALAGSDDDDDDDDGDDGWSDS